jgi:hypothetical protein
MKSASLAKEIIGMVIAIFFLILGFLVAYSVQMMQISMGDAAFIFLLITPLLVYLVLTGRLNVLKGPGGLEASFIAMAQQPAELMVSTSIDMIPGTVQVIDEGATAITKSSPQELATLEKRLEELPPVVLKLFLAAQHYQKEHLLTYLKRLLRYQTFKFVVFLDSKERFVAFIPAWAMQRILEGAEGERFVEIINQGKVSELWDFPGVQKRAISRKADSIQAVKEMTDRNLDAMVLLDEQEHVIGVVEREQVLSKLILAMAQP